MIAKKGEVYVAAGGYHMIVKKNEDGEISLKLDDGPPENFCKPSVEPMLRSLISIYGHRLLGVILTGMGQDGLKASRELAETGAPLIAQDKKTSVVWGMPGSVANAGICTDVLDVGKIGEKIADYMQCKVSV